MGYRSNVCQRWETGRSWPSASQYLRLLREYHGTTDVFRDFLQLAPTWLDSCGPESPESVAAFLRHLRGRTPIATMAVDGGFTRYQVSRWLSGTIEPSLPNFLSMVELSSRRMLDLVSLMADPERLPSLAPRWRQLERARRLAYDNPWSHAVLRALELEQQPKGDEQLQWIADRLGMPMNMVRESVEALVQTGQVHQQGGQYAPMSSMSVSTRRVPELARRLKVEWTRTALSRLEGGSPGRFGYSLFAVSRQDLQQLAGIHAEYVRAMQGVIAHSANTECVGLFCAQLLDLATNENALATT